MSIFYPFPLPTTGSIIFSQFINTVEHRQLVLNADEKRARLRDSLKRAKRAENPDILGVINAIQEYLPYLFTLMDGIETQAFEVINNQVPLFSWRLPMKAATSSKHIRVVEPPRVEVASFEYERGMTVLTYALAIIAFGEKTLKQSESTEKWKLMSNKLMQAESVLRYLAEQNVGLANNIANIPDLHPSTISGLITMVSGSLHLNIIYKSQAQGSASSSLLSRVSLYAAEKFGTASQLFSGSNHGGNGSNSNKKLLTNLLPNNGLSQWLKAARNFSIAYAEKYMADTSQQKGEVGLAIAYLQNAKEALNAVEDISKVYLQPMAGKLKSYIDESQTLFKAENDRIAFQPIPNSSEVEQNWPSGREVVPNQPTWVPPVSLLRVQNEYSSADSQEESNKPGREYF